jgi:hypothetical protein
VNRQPHKAESYFDHNAKLRGEVPHEVVEFEDVTAIEVTERRITREEFDALLLEAIRHAR